MEPMEPQTTNTRAISFLGQLWKNGESYMTVAQASSIEKAESIPKVKRVTAKRMVQKLGAGIVSIAAG